MNTFKILLIFFLLLGCNHPESKGFERNKNLSEFKSTENQTAYKVIGVKDGDTFVLLIDGKEQTVRFAHIDCPEKKQPFGTKAKQFVSENM